MLILACMKLKNLQDQVFSTADSIHTLDLTANSLKSGAEFKQFPNLVNLILDNNEFSVLEDFPTLPNLETFSANKNHFSSLSQFLSLAKRKFPKLKNLSLVNNPICPYFEGGSAYESYMQTVTNALPDLETLDGNQVNKQVKINIESKKEAGKTKKQDREENKKMEESVQTYKKENKGYKIKDTEEGQQEDERLDKDEEDEDEAQANERRLLSVIEYNEKYMNKPQRNMKLRSEGNRFVRNDQL